VPALLTRFALFLALGLGFAGPAAAEPPAFKPEQMGGTLRGNFNAEPRTLNPITTKDVYGGMVHDFVLETLIERDPDTLAWRGVLADRWEVSPDGLTITLHLDPRAKFSDGKPLTADDVVFTYQTIMNPKIDARSLASYYEDCQGCEKIDERTVRFVWRKAYFKSLEFSGSGFPVLPKHVYQFTDPDKFNNTSDLLVGTGPYKLTEWKTGQQIALARNENYWRNPAAFDRILFRVIIEEQASVQAMRADDLDYLALVPEWWVKLRRDPDVVDKFQWFRYTAPGAGYRFIGWNNARPPFNDARVRRAMTQLTWREQLLKYLDYDIGTLTTGPLWPQSPQYDHSVQAWPFDREAARRLLKEAGWEDRNGDGWLENAGGRRFQFELSYPAGNQQTRDLVRVLTEEFRRMGIDMSSRAYTWAVFSQKLDNRDFDAVRLGWGGGGVEEDPYQIWDSKSIADQGSNFVSFRNAQTDRLIETARTTLDEKARNDLYHQFHRLVHEAQPYTFLWSPDSLRMFAPRVKGLRVHKLGMDWHDWWIGREEAAKEKQAP
jgi:peptide/nickel transport system substrate-binding protein